MNRQVNHLVSAGLLWIALTAVGELLAIVDLYPTVGSHQAQDFDDIFRFLIIVGMPVYTFVLAVLFYCFLRFSTKEPMDDAPTIRGTGWVPKAWIGVTGLLAGAIMIYPGLIGLAEVRRDDTDYGWGEELEPDALVIDFKAFRWAWSATYAENGLIRNGSTGDDLVLPEGRQVRFKIVATDVLHAFWIPAFRMKIDAVPGRTVEITATPNRLGNFEDDAAYRLQCAELCGLNHAEMRMPVRVVSQEEFAQWVREQLAARPAPTPTTSPSASPAATPAR